MKIITDFEQARKLLSRRITGLVPDSAEKEEAVREIVEDVRVRGDAALYEYTKKFDGVRLSRLEVPKREINAAFRKIDARLLSSLKLAAERIAAFHKKQKKALLRDSARGNLGWVVRPLASAGVYVPGGTAPLPSSLLMTVIPARVAGVKEIILMTPPGKQGSISPVTLATARLAGVDRVFSVGGAQAIAALAYGTESVPRVDKIFGPGNIYVTLAKKLVFGTVGIDGLYGPSEVIIIADATANTGYIAADLLAQAEHGNLPSAILITTSRKAANAVNREMAEQLQTLGRRDIIDESLQKRGMIVLVDTVGKAVELANLYAPEHLCLVVKNAAAYVKKIKNAGCLFVGEDSAEVLVDYIAGPSHILPTGGTARFGSGLNMTAFVKLIMVVDMDKKDIRRLGEAASVIAKAEGLEAHAAAAEKRLRNLGQGGR